MPIAELGDIKLFYQTRGEGFPVLGIMGLGLDSRFWAGQIPAVTAGNKFITYDNRAVGRSTGPIPHTIDEMAEDAYRLLEHLEIEKCIVMGVSMGGAIAQRLTLDHPEKVSGLILGITWGRPIEFMRRQHELGMSLLEALGNEAFVDGSLIRMFTPRFFEMGRETVDMLVKAFYGDGTNEVISQEALLAQLEAVDKHDALADLASVSCPTLVFGGKMDQMVPGFASEELAATIPGARLQMFESGHGLTIEEGDKVNDLIQGFLAEVSP